MVHTFNSSTCTETGGSLRVWDQPGLYSEFTDSQVYTVRPYPKRKKRIINNLNRAFSTDKTHKCQQVYKKMVKDGQCSNLKQ